MFCIEGVAALLNAHSNEDTGEKGTSAPDVPRDPREAKEGISGSDRGGERRLCLEIDGKAQCAIKARELSRLRTQEDCTS